MSIRSSSRALVVATLVVGAALLGAEPAVGFSSISTSGTTGDWGVEDNAVVGQEGARCFYNNGTGGGSLLERVRVGPAIMWGASTTPSWVGWRFKILRSTDNGATYKVIYTSSLWKDKADLNNAADGFVSKNWYPQHALADARILVQINMVWYRAGSKTIVEGRASGRDDNYVEKLPGSTPTSTSPFCYTIEA